MLIKAVQAGVHPSDIDTADQDQALNPYGAAHADALVAMAHDALAGHPDHPHHPDAYTVTIVAERPALHPDHPDHPEHPEHPEHPDDPEHPDHPDDQAGEGDPVEQAGEAACQLDDGPGLAPQTVRRVACDNPTITVTEDPFGRLVDAGRRTRRINRTLRRALQHRDRHCRYPGCDRTRTHGHHIEHWIDGGPTNLDNLILLCHRHHHRLHEGGYRIQTDPHQGLLFIRPDGRIVPQQCPHPPLPDHDPARHATFAIPVNDQACQPNWDGSPLQ